MLACLRRTSCSAVDTTAGSIDIADIIDMTGGIGRGLSGFLKTQPNCKLKVVVAIVAADTDTSCRARTEHRSLHAAVARSTPSHVGSCTGRPATDSHGLYEVIDIDVTAHVHVDACVAWAACIHTHSRAHSCTYTRHYGPCAIGRQVDAAVPSQAKIEHGSGLHQRCGSILLVSVVS